MNKHFLAIIPARGGSKGIIRKNLLPLAGKPLIAWTIEASLNSEYITHTLVSSDDDEILRVAQSHGAEVLKRPSSLATDNASSESVVTHALNHTAHMPDFVVLLQPTSPLRGAQDIDDAVDYLQTTRASALISVSPSKHNAFKAFKQDENGFLTGAFDNLSPFMPRHQLPPRTALAPAAQTLSQPTAFLRQKLALA